MKTGSSKSTASASKKSPGGKKPSGTKASTGQQQKSRMEPDEEPLGAIMSKGMELAEAGLNLGINLVHKFGGSLQEQVIEKFARTGSTIFKSSAGEASPSPETAATSAGNTPDSGTEAAFSGITNRMPAFPGSELRISFSINNDSTSVARQVHLSLESDLLGELSGKTLGKKLFALQPSSVAIAPADFDKFTLFANIPVNQQADHYFGALIVDGEEKMRIPLRVSITGFSS